MTNTEARKESRRQARRNSEAPRCPHCGTLLAYHYNPAGIFRTCAKAMDCADRANGFEATKWAATQ